MDLLASGKGDLPEVKNIYTHNLVSALMYASKYGQLEAVKLLLQAGANIDLQEGHGRTALMYASMNGYLETVKLLLQEGANIDLQDKWGRTAPMYASRNGHLETVKLLLDKGATIDLQNSFGWTALMYASGEGQLEVVKFLRKYMLESLCFIYQTPFVLRLSLNELSENKLSDFEIYNLK